MHNDRTGFLMVVPWEVTAHGGVNGVIRNLVAQMQHAGQMSPLVLQNSWSHPRAQWGTVAGAPSAQLRLRSPLTTRSGAPALRGLVVYLLTLPRLVWTLARILRRHHVRVINIHYPALNAFTFILMKSLGLFGGTVILSFHGSDVRWAASLTGARKHLWDWVVSAADSITCVSYDLASAVTLANPSILEKLRVIHNGVEFDAFAATPRSKPLFSGALTVISVASFDHIKALDILLLAAVIVQKRYPRMRLMLVGESGREDDSLRRLSMDLGINANVDWRCGLDHREVPGLLAQADLFVLCSRYEALGLALLEAGASALPAIATRVGGIPEIIDDGRNGLLIPSEDPRALADAIFWMMEHAERAVEMGQALQRDVAHEFTWESACRQYVELGEAA